MKKLNTLFLTGLSVLSIPTLTITSCKKDSDKTEIQSTVTVENEQHFTKAVEVSKVYENEDFTFSFTLDNNCYVNESSSYVICGYSGSHKLNGRYVSCTTQDNTYTYTVNKNIVIPDFVFIYISTFKILDIDVSQTSTDDFEFVDELTPYPVENESYLIGFKVKNNKGLDTTNSIVTVGEETISLGQYLAFEDTFNSTTYTFIRIPSDYVTGNIKLNLKAGETVNTEVKTYPEYSLSYLSKPVKGNNFYCYLSLANPYRFEFDKDNVQITVGGSALSTDKYSLTDGSLYTYLKINGEAVTGDISIDIPLKEYFNVYASTYLEEPTVWVEGERAYKNTQYSFKVYPYNDKEILWDDANTYITVGEKKLTKADTLASGQFTAEESLSGEYWTVTIHQSDVIDDMYCHFITK